MGEIAHFSGGFANTWIPVPVPVAGCIAPIGGVHCCSLVDRTAGAMALAEKCILHPR